MCNKEQGTRMKTIFLHGKLGEKFGEKWSLDVSSPVEAARAINANKPGFLDYLVEKYEEGIEYKLKIGEEYIDEDGAKINYDNDFHIMPCARGGIQALVALFTNPWFWAALIATAAVTYAMYSLNKPPRPDDPIQKQSFLFQGVQNVMAQGNFVPIGYGKLKVGSQVIHSSITSIPISSYSYDEPIAADIGKPSQVTLDDLGYTHSKTDELLAREAKYNSVPRPPAFKPETPGHIKQ